MIRNLRQTFLVTGASGFVGSALCSFLQEHGHYVKASVRVDSPPSGAVFDEMHVKEIDGHTDWGPALRGVSCVIHCAARAHVVRETAADPLSVFREVNTLGTLRLAEQAAAHGVTRLVLLSTIGVLGIDTNSRPPFSILDTPNPIEDYAISKMEAERDIWLISARTGLEVVVVRAPLVYGPGVKGNFLRLLSLVSLGVPLPFRSINNLRSFVGLRNLMDLLLLCSFHSDAPGHTFLVADGKDLSTPELVEFLADGMGRSVHLLPVPAWIFRWGAGLVGKRYEVERLVGNLQVDCSFTRAQLGWHPTVSVAEGLREMAQWYAGAKA